MNNHKKLSISFLFVSVAVIFLIIIFKSFVTKSTVNAAECSNDCGYNIGNFKLFNNKWGSPGATQSIFVKGIMRLRYEMYN